MSLARRTAPVLAAILVLALPARGLATDSSVGGYGGPGGSVEAALGQDAGSSAPGLRGPTAKRADEGGRLPFTGRDVGFVGAVGLGLLLLGLGLSLMLSRGRRAPALATAGDSGHGQSVTPLASSGENEAALTVAMEMMIDGNTRDEVSRYLHGAFRIEDADAVADEAFRLAQSRTRSALAMNVGARLGHRK